MASKSRAAQQALSELEKSSAQFEDQLVEAAKFIGSDLDVVSGSASSQGIGKEQKKASKSHGKEEWLLKWLLKKLQAPKDDVPRKTSLSWNLVLLILQRLPLPVAARILGERKFAAILQKTLDEAKQRPVEEQANAESNSVDEKETSKKSKKRKRSGEAASKSSVLNQGILSLLSGILAVVDFIVDSTRPKSGNDDNGTDSGFSAEYMRTVLRTSSEDSAKLLGSWLLVLRKHDILLTSDLPWLSSFIEIWQLHLTDENYLMHFSLHCTMPLLSLLGNLSATSSFETQIEQLLARNIVIPSKASKDENSESTVLDDLTKLAVISDSANASRLFGIAIRSIQPQGLKRRRPNDDVWLQAVFSSLRSSMPPKRLEQNGKAICAMIQSAINHKVDLELDVLRSVASEYALPQEGETYWELLQLMIELDANVYLIPNPEKDLLQDLLQRLNQISIGEQHLNIPKMVVEDVVLPLMGSFAKARDLTGFIHHWFTQLVEVEKSRKALALPVVQVSGVWEDSRLQEQLKQLLESSLSANQIVQLLDWLESQVTQHTGPVAVILQALSGSIKSEEVVDAVSLRCYHILFNSSAFETLDDRYMWRSWAILLNTFVSANRAGIEEFSGLWMAQAKPFDRLSTKVDSSKLMDIHSTSTGFGAMEVWKFSCAAWNAAREGSQLQKLATPLVVDLLKRFSSEIKKFLQTVSTSQINGDKWIISRLVKSLFKEYPKVLVLAAETEDKTTRKMLQNIFWLASASHSGDVFKSDSPEPSNLPDPVPMTFPDMWLSALQSDIISNNPIVAEMMIDTMLDNESNSLNPLIKTTTNNSFAIKSLLQLPIGSLHRKHRERIMKAWLPISSGPGVLDPAVLSLKIKTMRFPMFYEGMEFQQLSDMAIALATPGTPDILVNLSLYKEFCKLTLDFVFTNIDQARNQTYIQDAFTYVQKSVKKSHKHAKHETKFGSIALFEVVLESIRVNSRGLFQTEAIRGKDVTKVEALVHDSLFAQLQASLTDLSDDGDSDWDTDLAVVSILSAFVVLGLEQEKVRGLKEKVQDLRMGKSENGINIKNRLDAFISSQMIEISDDGLAFEGADSSSIHGRLLVQEKTQLVLSTVDRDGKLRLVKSILSGSTGRLLELGQILAVRQIILSIDDTRQSKKSDDSDSDNSEDEDESLDLSATYSLLCGQLQKAKSIRHFCLISETLELMLRTKARSISQWNIDNTIGCISTICSRNGPSLRSSRGSTVYLHLCHLFQSILLSHRLKLEGHFHVVIQAIQSLLRCLFTPLPYSSTKILKLYAPPLWLSTTASTYPLNATHATAFTRLITLICDPSVSSVTRSSHNNLTSATDKAKRMAGQHMQFVLMSYVRLQLEMKMLPEMREKMTPGLYAIFDTTTVELRRCISESLDSSGRAVFGMLYKDYIRFGKWKGS